MFPGFLAIILRKVIGRPAIISLVAIAFASGAPPASPHKTFPVPQSSDGSARPAVSHDAWLWAPGTEIKVFFIKGHFSAPEQLVLREVVHDWSTIARELQTGVSFSYAGETKEIVVSKGILTLMRSDLRGTKPRIWAYFQPRLLTPKGLLTSAVIYLEYQIQKLNVLVSFTSHEMGHGFGLGDCPDCQQTMMRYARDQQHPNGFYWPTSSDKTLIKARYARISSGDD